MEQQPGRELHQSRSEPHAFGGVGERAVALELLRFLPAQAVEIGCRLLNERHAVAEQVGKSLRARQPFAERNGLVDRILGHRLRASRYADLAITPARPNCASPNCSKYGCGSPPALPEPSRSRGPPVQRWRHKAFDIVAAQPRARRRPSRPASETKAYS